MSEGIHTATLREIARVFRSPSRHRGLLFQRIHEIASATGHLARFVVYGSFVTSNSNPNDVDVFMVFDDTFDASAYGTEVALLLDHAAAMLISVPVCFGCDGLLLLVANKLQ